jgi:carbon-monoxide dehydrogenase small subunit
MAVPLTFTLNGSPTEWLTEPRQLAVHLLRAQAGDTSVHVGCDTAQCGACTVLVDGQPTKTCNVLAVQLEGRSVVTIRGLAERHGVGGHPMVSAFARHHAVQCGFCTPAMVLTGIAIADRHASPLDPDVVRHELHGNLCRCTGYQSIVEAICAGAAELAAASGSDGVP